MTGGGELHVSWRGKVVLWSETVSVWWRCWKGNECVVEEERVWQVGERDGRRLRQV